jgi:hypothetical protein
MNYWGILGCFCHSLLLMKSLINQRISLLSIDTSLGQINWSLSHLVSWRLLIDHSWIVLIRRNYLSLSTNFNQLGGYDKTLVFSSYPIISICCISNSLRPWMKYFIVISRIRVHLTCYIIDSSLFIIVFKLIFVEFDCRIHWIFKLLGRVSR